MINPTGCLIYNFIHPDLRTARYQILKVNSVLKVTTLIKYWKHIPDSLIIKKGFQHSKDLIRKTGMETKLY